MNDAEKTLAGRWRLNPQVALRPERFGALAYHFGTRRLSFLKSTQLLEVVRRLEAAADPDAACRAAGVGDAELPHYRRALTTLADTEMIVPVESSVGRGTLLSHTESNPPQEVAA